MSEDPRTPQTYPASHLTPAFIRRALQLTYPFVFVDEFQDTTYAQYDFLLSAFAGAEIAVTAVGDDKQRIMTWAGARIDAFERIAADFAAVRIPLLFNFRSSPDLVRIQHVVARALDPNAAPTVSFEFRLDRPFSGAGRPATPRRSAKTAPRFPESRARKDRK